MIAIKYYTPVSSRSWAGVTIHPTVGSDVDIAIDRTSGQVALLWSRLTADGRRPTADGRRAGQPADEPANLFLATKP